MIDFPPSFFSFTGSSVTEFSSAAAAFSHLTEKDVGCDFILVKRFVGLFSTTGRLALYRRIKNMDRFA